jgi:hypothetical protein
MLPAALIYLVYQHRLDHSHSTTTSEAVGVPGVQPTAR